MIQKKIFQWIALLLAVLMVNSLVLSAAAEDFDSDLLDLLSGGHSGPADKDTEADDPSDTFDRDLNDLLSGGKNTESTPAEPETYTEDGESSETETSQYPQLTGEDIIRLDEGDAEIIYNDEGRATFIRGRYSPEKVLDQEDAVESLNYVASLLGLTNGALFFCVYKSLDSTTGYTHYLFLQRDGDVTVINAAIKVYVDPEGYTAGLSCSFNPSTGVREESAGKITAERAEQIVLEYFPDLPLKVYEDATSQAGFMEKGQNTHVWSVFTNNPDADEGSSDMPYLQHFVSYSGEYRMNLPAMTISTPLLDKDDGLEKRAKALFEGYEKAVWRGAVSLHDGSTLDLTIPVAYDPEDERYYLMDLDRKMMVADYSEAMYGSGEIVISSSDDNTGWEDRELLAMYNIGRAYDYYADHGLESVDGSGIPILILSGVCGADGTPVDNAYFSGYMSGFGVFAVSDINNTVESLDVMAHEFTHGITSYTMGGCAYVNEMGAINEAYSDIMGNLCELTYYANDLSISQGMTSGQFDVTGTSTVGSTDDPSPDVPDWRIGEISGKAYRDLSDPVRYYQPAFVGDAYYCLPTEHSSMAGNDYGGVHENSSLLGSIAWVMNQHGLSFEKQYSLWVTAMSMMTPLSGYDEILQALILARKSFGYEEEIDSWLTEAFAERGMLEGTHSQSGTWDGVSFVEYNRKILETNSGVEQSKDTSGEDSWLSGVGLDESGRICRRGFGRIEFKIAPECRDIVLGAFVMDPLTQRIIAVNCLDEEDTISFLIPEGSWYVFLNVNKEGWGQVENWIYTAGGSYARSMTAPAGLVDVQAGKTTTLPDWDYS